MEKLDFNFDDNEYIFYLKLSEKAEIGVLELEKEKIKNVTEYEQEKYLNNIASLDYETLYKLEEKVNPKDLVKIVSYINESTFILCNTKERKEFLEQNLKNRNYEINIVWKLKI